MKGTAGLKRGAGGLLTENWEPGRLLTRHKSMKRLGAVFATLGLVGLMTAPASGLSCAEQEPVDWSKRLPAADAAAIGVVESVKEFVSDGDGRGFLLEVRVTERLHGRIGSSLDYTVSNFDPWGPYYEVGQEIAIVIEDDVVTDGVMHLCGPWFTPDELRQAAADLGLTVENPSTAFDRFLRLFHRILRNLFSWDLLG